MNHDDIRCAPKPNGVELIAAERARQISEEGYTPEHDDEHTDGSLLELSVVYAAHADESGSLDDIFEIIWPSNDWWKPSPATTEGRIRDLTKAGALIAAEIDRLQRKGQP